MGIGAILFEYPIGGSILVLNFDYFITWSVDFPTIDKFIVVGRFLIFWGKLSASLVKDGLES